MKIDNTIHISQQISITGSANRADSKAVQGKSSAETDAKVDAKADPVDVFEKSTQSSDAKTTYTIDAQSLSRLKKDADTHFQALRTMVENLITKQGQTIDRALGGEVIIEVDEATREEAAAQIADDGYWGVEQTSGRILDFARSLSGGDPSKIDLLRGAFEMGFKQASDAFGGELPEISQKTFEAVIKGFDEWAAESSPDVEPESISEADSIKV